jgi:hypothetical protein
MGNQSWRRAVRELHHAWYDHELSGLCRSSRLQERDVGHE